MKLIILQIVFAVMMIALLFAAIAWASAFSANAKSVNQPRRHRGLRRTWRKIYLAPLLIHRALGYLPGRIAPAGEVQFANIGEGTFGTGVRSYLPDATTSSRYLLYKRGTDADHCAICGAGDDPIGPSDDQADSTTTPIAVNILGAVRGTLRIITDGTLADGDYVKCGANGKGTKATNGDLCFGRAQIGTDSSKADGDVITLIPALPAKHPF